MTIQLGWLDTNVFVHNLFDNDPLAPRCREIVDALEAGTAEGWIDITVVHELTYALSRFSQFPSRQAVHDYVETILLRDNVHADDMEMLLDTLARWLTAGGSFVDVWLAIRAQRRGLPVCSANRRHFPGVENTF